MPIVNDGDLEGFEFLQYLEGENPESIVIRNLMIQLDTEIEERQRLE